MSVWLYIGGLTAATMAVFVWSLYRRADYAVAGHDSEVYRTQLSEIRREVETGLISKSDAEALEAEITRRILKSNDAEFAPIEGNKGFSWNPRTIVTLLIICAAPVIAIALYATLGNPNLPDQPFAERKKSPPAAAHSKADIAQLMKTLTERTQKEPDKYEHWLMLGRAQMVQKMYDDATTAYGNAAKLAPERPDILSAYGEASVFRDRGKVSDQTVLIFEMALAANSSDTKSLFYTGLYAAQQKDNRKAIQAWTNMLAASPQNAFWTKDVKNRIQVAAKAGGIDPATIKPTITPAFVLPKLPPLPPIADKAPEQSKPVAESVQMSTIRDMVAGLAARLKKEPSDLQGWMMLARSYRVLGETAKAEMADARVKSLKAGGQ